MMQLVTKYSRLALAIGAISLTSLAGCDEKEKVLDVETPNGGVEVERNVDSGEVDVDVDE